MSVWRTGLVTVGSLGLLRPAPGTWGSTPPVIVALLAVWLVGPGWTVQGILIGLGLIFAIACVRLGGYAEQRFGKKDPGQVVADEVAGQCIALLWLPWRSFADEGGAMWNILLALGAFAAFRVFDITKPPPINQLQSIKGGWGILIDDLVAGVYALALVQVVSRGLF